jgi:hypothetical protein
MSYHLDGTPHMKSFGHKFVSPQKRRSAGEAGQLA